MIARRSFFKTILGTIAGVALAQKIALEAVCAKAPEPEELKLNTQYVDATYEALCFLHPDAIGLDPAFPSSHPERWTFTGGEFKKVP